MGGSVRPQNPIVGFEGFAHSPEAQPHTVVTEQRGATLARADQILAVAPVSTDPLRLTSMPQAKTALIDGATHLESHLAAQHAVHVLVTGPHVVGPHPVPDKPVKIVHEGWMFNRR